MPRATIERRLPWPRARFWRPGEPLTLTEDGRAVTYRLRGVMRDAEPDSPFATLVLEPVRAVDARDEDPDADGPRLSAAG